MAGTGPVPSRPRPRVPSYRLTITQTIGDRPVAVLVCQVPRCRWKQKPHLDPLDDGLAAVTGAMNAWLEHAQVDHAAGVAAGTLP